MIEKAGRGRQFETDHRIRPVYDLPVRAMSEDQRTTFRYNGIDRPLSYICISPAGGSPGEEDNHLPGRLQLPESA